VARKARTSQPGDNDDQVQTVDCSAPPVSPRTYFEQIGVDTLQDVAKVFFLSNWAQGIHQQYVPPLYRRKDRSVALRTSIEAVGFAALSLNRREARLMIAARQSHAVALKEIQHAIGTWETVRRADTLAAIMLLTLFAGITSEPDAARINWTSHIKGALAILNSYESTEDNDPVVNILSNHVTSCVLVDCLQSAVAPPKRFLEIKFEPRITVSFQEKSEHVLEILADLRQRPITIDTAATIFADLDMVDSKLDESLRILPLKHPRTIVPESQCADEPPLHICPSHNSARVWNTIRLTKLSAYELRYEKVKVFRDLEANSDATFDIDYDQQLEYASTSATAMIRDICASVSKRLRLMGGVKHPDLIAYSHSLLRPLSAARASPHAPQDLQTFLHRQLQVLWNVTKFPIIGYRQEEIDDAVKPHIWTHGFFMS